MSPPPGHFGAYLSPIHEVPFHEEQDISDTLNQEAMEALTFLPEVDSVPLTPASREALKHLSPSSPFQATPSAEDLSLLSGMACSEHETFNKSWSGKLKGLIWSLGTSALAALSSDRLTSQNNTEEDQDWKNVEDGEISTSMGVAFPFSSNSFTFGSAAEPQPLRWD